MALKRGNMYATHRLARLGLCLTLAFAFAVYVAAELPRRPGPTAPGETRLAAWIGRKIYQIGAELELWLHIGKEKQPSNESTLVPPAPVNLDPVVALGIDPSGLREALALYKAGDLRQADSVAETAKDPLVRTTLAWFALWALPPATGFERITDFLADHPTWPARTGLEHRMEEMLYLNNASPDRIERYFSGGAPTTVLGRLALARAFKSEGDETDAQRLIRTVWHRSVLPAPLENKVKAEFSGELDKADFKLRADALLYNGDSEAALRAAAVAGPPVVALAKLRIAANANGGSDRQFAAVPKPMQSDPGYLFARIQKLQRTEKFKEAAGLMLAAPRDHARLVDGDEWWFAARTIARKLLDLNDATLAYRLCAEHFAATNEFRIEEEFEAGWIALRFLNQPERAAKHFAAAAFLAETPASISRARYWQGRAAEASGREDAAARAMDFYEMAAAQSATYYGQLAREKLGLKTTPLHDIDVAAVGSAREEAIRVVELLFAVGEREAAFALASSIAQHETSESQIGALASVIAAQRDAHMSLIIGKLLAQRRIAIDSLAFPTYGVPHFDPLENSASPALVYAIARQESAFDSKAVSSAGAKGLMQMIAATAKQTAQRAGLIFDPARLTDDAAFNAKLGAAHLGRLLAEEKGCPILVFAAYNAGPGRVKQWITAYGDPRSPDVDPVDWVERIPFAETRNYVQRVMENLTIYEARFGEASTPEMLREVHAKL